MKTLDVECFSYIYGEDGRNSDAQISKKMSESFGFNHKMVESYKGNLMEVLNDNVRMLQEGAHFSPAAVQRFRRNMPELVVFQQNVRKSMQPQPNQPKPIAPPGK